MFRENLRPLAKLVGIAAALALAGCSSEPADPNADGALYADADNWPSWGRTPGEQHFSPLDEIDTGNVDELKLAWSFDVEPGFSASTPLAADGKMFITTGHSKIRALDAVTGEQLWEYDGGTRDRASNPLHIQWGNKGIAYSEGKVFLATTDGFVVALNADSGEEAWKKRDFEPQEIRYINGAPRVFDGKVIVGHGGADITPIRGYVSAYDAETGELAWRFHTVPSDPSKPAESKADEVARPTWKGDWYGKGGGGTVWNAMSYDPELNLIFLGVGNGFPYNQDLRSPGGGDNLFLASIVAVNAETGEYVWHYQTCPAEQWDCTATTDITLATLEIDGEPRKVVMQAPKNGFFYVVDRETGEFISANNFAKVTWAEKIGEDGRPIENPGIRYQGKEGMFEMWPGPTGAHSWMPQAFNPESGFVYIPVIEQGALISEGGAEDGAVGGGMGVNLLVEADLEGTRRSFLKAWDPIKQEAAWEVELPGSWPAGVMTTAGGLVFQGRMDGNLVAYDAESGEELWSFKTAAPIVGAPISYRVNGTQYVSVITGANGQGSGFQTLGNADYRTDYRAPRRVLTFALNGEAKLPTYTPPERTVPADPDFVPDMARIEQGAMMFGTGSCLVCHGYNAVGGGQAPDLRYSPTIVDAATFKAIVKEGALKANGMPIFPQFSDYELETLRIYLRARAQQVAVEEAAKKAAAKEAAGADGKATAASFAGQWDLAVSTPLGETKAKLTLKRDGDNLTGMVKSDQGDMALSGKVVNGRAKLKGKATNPFPMDVEYDLAISGKKMSGKTKSGAFGTFDLTGSKQG